MRKVILAATAACFLSTGFALAAPASSDDPTGSAGQASTDAGAMPAKAKKRMAAHKKTHRSAKRMKAPKADTGDMNGQGSDMGTGMQKSQ